VSDELLRRFRDKIQGRPPGRRRGTSVAAEGVMAENAGVAETSEDDLPADSIRIRGLQHGAFPGISDLNPRFQPGLPRVRLTLDIGQALRRRLAPLEEGERERLLALCPRLADHLCGGGSDIRHLLGEPANDPAASADSAPAEPDGLALAHLIEHVAIELVVAAGIAPRCSGVTCAYRDRLDRFDIFLECADPHLGRAAAVLAAASVRDLLSGPDRLEVHRRCRDLLRLLVATGRASIVPEDAAIALGCGLAGAREALEALARLGFVDPVAASLTFSSSTGVTFRRARAEA